VEKGVKETARGNKMGRRGKESSKGVEEKCGKWRKGRGGKGRYREWSTGIGEVNEGFTL